MLGSILHCKRLQFEISIEFMIYWREVNRDVVRALKIIEKILKVQVNSLFY